MQRKNDIFFCTCHFRSAIDSVENVSSLIALFLFKNSPRCHVRPSFVRVLSDRVKKSLSFSRLCSVHFFDIFKFSTYVFSRSVERMMRILPEGKE